MKLQHFYRVFYVLILQSVCGILNRARNYLSFFGSILQSGAFKVSREGHVLLQFAPAVGVRLYDWNRKQVTCASSVTLGSI